MNELGLLFPYTAVYLFDELFSPILTPFILIWHLRYQYLLLFRKFESKNYVRHSYRYL
jgi:hypothetical protein